MNTTTRGPRTIRPMAGKTGKDRTERLELRLSEEDKALLMRAADVCGDDLGVFVRRVALIEAHALLFRVGKTTGS